MAISCQKVGTNVGFTAETDESSLCSSSSGGGLFGRPMTREGQGALLNFGPYRCLGVWSFFKDDSDCGTVSILQITRSLDIQLIRGLSMRWVIRSRLT